MSSGIRKLTRSVCKFKLGRKVSGKHIILARRIICKQLGIHISEEDNYNASR